MTHASSAILLKKDASGEEHEKSFSHGVKSTVNLPPSPDRGLARQ